MLIDPSTRYTAFQSWPLPNRQWPNRQTKQAPIWLSTDLRDGNQALAEPMSIRQKLGFFHLLLRCGFKEIEVAFPAASQTEFDFVRLLIEDGHVPDDVTLQVITQSRPDLIDRTMASLRGARRAIVHLYNASAPIWREQVFGLEQEGVIRLAVDGCLQIKALCAARPETEWLFQYSPETFSATEPDFALEICCAVIDAWQPSPQAKMILNLPATVEMSTPNTYADQIEWMSRRLPHRDSLILSVHPHNDRGTGVAAAELALLAGAERVEGCLFGNGERTGNVDLLTLALNLYSQGIAPRLDFSDIDSVRRQVEDFLQLAVHPRHPYAGELVYTAFSGSHQDAIKKGFARQRAEAPWRVPYLPLDPADVGRSYEAVIRVNSQSGKGGISWLLERHYGLQLPRALQQDFSQLAQEAADSSGKELAPQQLYRLFRQTYLPSEQSWRYLSHQLESESSGLVRLKLEAVHQGKSLRLEGSGNGVISALLAALPETLQVQDYHEHALGAGANASAICYIRLMFQDGFSLYAAAEDNDVPRAAIRAVMAGLNRATLRTGQADGIV
ncbi:2-isopropylmalate synthase [Chromobacterium sp. S0633]|uniref:2-isopropylmalate synthase n=1 Tax=Chromobacterium sp. S0633 TaxID=2957805 RepID=UPI0020A042A8|nr:2-isopropylmalate synthase [Chromobacterium sp. S0633]MCP1290357.1 2-isopropylmalate synthase [Chromobacterium sp. S0633]